MALSVHLLSSIAVVGRDNEPIYLRGDLSDIITTTTSSLQLDLDKILHMHNAVFDDHEHDDESSIHDTSTIDADAPHTPREELGEIELLSTPKENNHAINTDTTKEDEDEASDPFGFFNESHHSSSMSLTNQLVLHASLDRFEEMAQSSSGAVRWRMPGSYGANAMWMGRLCEVEERWNVYGVFMLFVCLFITSSPSIYRSNSRVELNTHSNLFFHVHTLCLGYLTNTGIKFMILLENVQINEDGVVRFHHVPILDNQSCLHREAELKNMFVSVQTKTCPLEQQIDHGICVPHPIIDLRSFQNKVTTARTICEIYNESI